MGFRFGETTLEWFSVARPLVLTLQQWPITSPYMDSSGFACPFGWVRQPWSGV